MVRCILLFSVLVDGVIVVVLVIYIGEVELMLES